MDSVRRLEDCLFAVGDFVEEFLVPLIVLGLVAVLYLVFQGPNVSGWTQIDDRCWVHSFHDHRLFAADPAEVRTVYCEDRR